MGRSAGAIVGFQALGRHGALGIVVDVGLDGEGFPAIVVRGGISDALLYFVPCGKVRAVSIEERTVIVDADLADFDHFLRADGTIELRPAPST